MGTKDSEFCGLAYMEQVCRLLVAAPGSFGASAAASRFGLVRFLSFPAFPVMIVAV